MRTQARHRSPRTGRISTSLRRVTAGVALGLAAASTAACGAATTGASSATTQQLTAPPASALDGKGEVQVTFWHAMGGKNGEALQRLTDQFNQRNQGRIKVTLQYKNNYDDTLSAYKTALNSGQAPDLVQVYDIGTRFMIDSGSTVPVQSFVDVDKADISDIQPNIAGYYTVDNTLYSMPFNTSMPLLYINRTAFVEAGLDPDKPPRTLDEITAAARKLTVRDANGNITRYGFGTALYGWFVEQWTALAGQEFCDQGNGRDGRATKVNLATDEHVKQLEWWQRMTEEGLALKFNSDTAESDNAFTSGKTAMTLESTGSLGGFLANAEGKFEVGTGFYPKADASHGGGPIIGGASLWIVGKGKDDAHKRAAWEFTRFLATPDAQATWHTATGYFPISKSALDTDLDKQWRAQRPQFDTAIKQLESTALTKATQGCALGVMPQARKAEESAMQAAVHQGTDPRQALQDAEKSLDSAIKDYNQSVGG
ncbi:ABC transporter substrate-binding protein [Goodfellowiella coeruleoviolacea]|uniref:Sn-glycerol 3-phosphate transport system substrate-binding protein n=1 Tax=Goodfellowiella coeruleoviolacea TaxID=334858 RepID=A0AAE3GKN2_9PSEU|nr:ABC transporter substrate-binding protein [Goodfellowiella coeruleoviolacea]MCP2169915.1 sn-glycerol 3-phosphate transport system substrate-binding protein [Goodfellowiella coeruleoviolacea]